MTSIRRVQHRRSIRLRDYDYSEEGGYFVTICTHNKECVFGEIANEEMNLNEIGKIVYEEWLKTPNMRPNVKLEKFVVMPNHLHGIIILHDDSRGTLSRYIGMPLQRNDLENQHPIQFPRSFVYLNPQPQNVSIIYAIHPKRLFGNATIGNTLSAMEMN